MGVNPDELIRRGHLRIPQSQITTHERRLKSFKLKVPNAQYQLLP